MIPHPTLFQHQLTYVWPTIQHEKLFTQNVTNITFIFETSPNTKPKEKKVGGHIARVPHQIATMPVLPSWSLDWITYCMELKHALSTPNQWGKRTWDEKDFSWKKQASSMIILARGQFVPIEKVACIKYRFSNLWKLTCITRYLIDTWFISANFHQVKTSKFHWRKLQEQCYKSNKIKTICAKMRRSKQDVITT